MSHHISMSLTHFCIKVLYIFLGSYLTVNTHLATFPTCFVCNKPTQQRPLLSLSSLCQQMTLFIWYIYSAFVFLADYIRMGSSWESWVVLLCIIFWNFVVLFSLNRTRKNLSVLVCKWWLAGESCGSWLAVDVRDADLSWLRKIWNTIFWLRYSRVFNPRDSKSF